MKTRLDLFKSASDFAFETLDQPNPVALDIQCAQKFQTDQQAPEDYQVWKQYFSQARMQFLGLSKQPAPSNKPAPKPAAAAPVPAATNPETQ